MTNEWLIIMSDLLHGSSGKTCILLLPEMQQRAILILTRTSMLIPTWCKSDITGVYALPFLLEIIT